jgi:hypothetical protein
MNSLTSLQIVLRVPRAIIPAIDVEARRRALSRAGTITAIVGEALGMQLSMARRRPKRKPEEVRRTRRRRKS